MSTGKATIHDYIACAERLARALRTTPFYECHQLHHATKQYHKHNEPCPVCKENEAALLELERLSRLPVEMHNNQAEEGLKPAASRHVGMPPTPGFYWMHGPPCYWDGSDSNPAEPCRIVLGEAGRNVLWTTGREIIFFVEEVADWIFWGPIQPPDELFK